MNVCLYLLLFMLHITAGCFRSDQVMNTVTGYTAGSVLLPCSCDDPQSTVQTFTWLYLKGQERNEVFKNENYKGRWKLFNENSPTNLSLLISDLRKEDEGHYRCEISSNIYRDITITIKDIKTNTTAEPKKHTEEPEQSEANSTQSYVLALISVFSLLLLTALAIMFWRCRGARNVKNGANDGLVLCSNEEKQGATQEQHIKQNENEDVTYSAVVHVKTAVTSAHTQIDTAELSVYSTIKRN